MDNEYQPTQPMAQTPVEGQPTQTMPQQNQTAQPTQAMPQQNAQAMPMGAPQMQQNAQQVPPTQQVPPASQVPPQQPGWMLQQQYINAPGMSTRSKIVAGLFGIFLGMFGVHNFYLGNTGKAVGQLLLTIFGSILFFIGPVASAVWGLVEGVQILGSHPGSHWHQDADGLQLQD